MLPDYLEIGPCISGWFLVTAIGKALFYLLLLYHSNHTANTSHMSLNLHTTTSVSRYLWFLFYEWIHRNTYFYKNSCCLAFHILIKYIATLFLSYVLKEVKMLIMHSKTTLYLTNNWKLPKYFFQMCISQFALSRYPDVSFQ